MRSESHDVSASVLSKRILFGDKPRKVIPPSSVDYWLPSYADAIEEESNFTDFSQALNSSSNSSLTDEKGMFSTQISPSESIRLSDKLV
jgi:hypothetical protein